MLGIFWTTFTIRSLLDKRTCITCARTCLTVRTYLFVCILFIFRSLMSLISDETVWLMPICACTVPMRQVVSLDDESKWGAEFRVYSHGAPQLWVSKSSPGLNLHLQVYDQRSLTGRWRRHGIFSACCLTCRVGLVCPCTVCLNVTLASLDPPCAPKPPMSPITLTLQSWWSTSTEALRRGPAGTIIAHSVVK